MLLGRRQGVGRLGPGGAEAGRVLGEGDDVRALEESVERGGHLRGRPEGVGPLIEA